jgi:hypothetical protein
MAARRAAAEAEADGQLPPAGRGALPDGWRWGALLWLAIWIPAYAVTWGWRNFLALCDVAVLLGCLGLVTGSRLLIGSQALPAVLVGGLWLCDVTARLLSGAHLFGGTEYMWDSQVPLAVRLLSLFHLLLPVVLVSAVRRLGYDRRALPLQAALTAALLVAARVAGGGRNLNYVLREPLFGRSLGPAPLHLTAVLIGIVILVYLPTHVALGRWARPRQPAVGRIHRGEPPRRT